VITNTTFGLVGEHIAASVILSLGWRCAMAQQDKVDLISWHDDDPSLFLRIQVKSSRLKYRKGRAEGYHFNLGTGLKKQLPGRDDYDILALVATTDRQAAFFPILQLRQSSKRLPRAFFAKTHLEEDSWQRAVEIMREVRS